jgi:hypothetical protein
LRGGDGILTRPCGGVAIPPFPSTKYTKASEEASSWRPTFDTSGSAVSQRLWDW